MKLITLTGIALVSFWSATAAAGDETGLQIKDAPSAATVRANCSICHSIDYIPMNSPFLNKAGWDAEVHKMINAMGAPVPENQVTAIVDYLTKYYGVK